MAILGVDSLTGCSSIPSFLGGSGDTPANPTVALFRNTNAPTNWVKKITHDNKALRVIGGANGTSLSPGGSSPFTTILSPSVSLSGSFDSKTSGVSINPITNGYGSSPDTFGPSSSNVSSTDSIMAAHTHDHVQFSPAVASSSAILQFASGNSYLSSSTAQTSSPANHSHPVSMPHSHPISDSGHIHTLVSPESPHTHTVTTSAISFAVQYVDIIIATKS